jgi:carbonic anhydrase
MTNDLTAHFIHAQNSTLTCFSILSDHGLNAKQLRMILLEHLKRHLFRQSTTASF